MPRQRSEYRGFDTLESSNIQRVMWYLPDSIAPLAEGATDVENPSGTLVVQFKPRGDAKEGATYRYASVRLDVYLRLRDAESIGSTFDVLVRKGNYTYQRVDAQGLLPGGDE